MNCTQAKNNILLLQSGELSPGASGRLEAHLRDCPACRAYRDQLSTLVSMSRSAPLEHELSEFTVRRILSGAERAQRPSRHVPDGSFVHLWRPALVSGVAAVVLILFGIRFADRTAAPEARTPGSEVEFVAADSAGEAASEIDLLAWDPDLEDDLARIDTLLALAAEDGTNGSDASSDRLDQLAEELMALENWNI